MQKQGNFILAAHRVVELRRAYDASSVYLYELCIEAPDLI